MVTEESITKAGFGIIIVMGIGILIIVGIVIFESLDDTLDSDIISIQEKILANYNDAQVLTDAPIGGSANGTRNNQTWVDCDGLNDVVELTESEIDSITFWYNSSTSNVWIFIANVTGTTYVDGIANVPVEYPIFWDGSKYDFCMTDAVTFWDGWIDDVRIYSGQLNTTEITTLYTDGRV